MSNELKEAAQDAAEAIDWLLKNIRLDAPQLSGKAMGNAEKCASALRTAIQQAEAQQPATPEPVLTVEREPDYWSGGHFYEGSRPHINPTKVWSLPIGTELYTRPVPSVPEGYALVPIEPTQAMMNVQTWDFSSFYSPREIWAAMLAAKDSK